MTTLARHFDSFLETLQKKRAEFAGEGFSAWLEELLAYHKRSLVLTGVGKSGYIALALSAGLRSVGVSAHFMHATEAAHGDLGALQTGHAVLAFSKSGSSSELFALIDYCARQQIALFALTLNKEGYLATHASHPFAFSPVEERPPVDLMPTTSNLIFSHAAELIKLAFAKSFAFTNETFVATHPGGIIGQSEKPISRLMRTGASIPVCRPDTSLREALIALREGGAGCVLVMKDKGLLGILTDGDIQRHLVDGTDILSASAEALMSQNPVTLPLDTELKVAVGVMAAKSITQIPIIKKGELAGLLLLHDIARDQFDDLSPQR